MNSQQCHHNSLMQSSTRTMAMHHPLYVIVAALSMAGALGGCKKPQAEEPLAIEAAQSIDAQSDSSLSRQRPSLTRTPQSSSTPSAPSDVSGAAASASQDPSTLASGTGSASASGGGGAGTSGGRLTDRLAANSQQTSGTPAGPEDMRTDASPGAPQSPLPTVREPEPSPAETRKILGIAESLVKVREFDLPENWQSIDALPTGDPLREVVGHWVQVDAPNNNRADFGIGGYENQTVLLTNSGELWSIRSGAGGNHRQVGYRVKVDGSSITLVELIGGEGPLSGVPVTWVGAEGQPVRIEPAVAKVPHRMRYNREGAVMRLRDREFRLVPERAPAESGR